MSVARAVAPLLAIVGLAVGCRGDDTPSAPATPATASWTAEVTHDGAYEALTDAWGRRFRSLSARGALVVRSAMPTAAGDGRATLVTTIGLTGCDDATLARAEGALREALLGRGELGLHLTDPALARGVAERLRAAGATDVSLLDVPGVVSVQGMGRAAIAAAVEGADADVSPFVARGADGQWAVYAAERAPALDGRRLAAVRREPGADGRDPYVVLKFDDASRVALSDLGRRGARRALVVALDGDVVATPIVAAGFDDGEAWLQIPGGDEAADALVAGFERAMGAARVDVVALTRGSCRVRP